MMERANPCRPLSVLRSLLVLALVPVIAASCTPPAQPPAPAPSAAVTAPLPAVETSAPATTAPTATATPSASPTATPTATPDPAFMVAQRDWPGLARTFDVEAAMAEIEALCGPELAGREAGSPGGRQAAEYIAGRFQALGLQPAGDGGSYFQGFTVPLINMTAVPSLTLTNAGGATFRADFIDDFMPLARGYAGAGLADGPLVWAKHGEPGDLVGVSVAGAVVVLAPPAGLPAFERLFQSGAAGALVVHEEEGQQMAWVTRGTSPDTTMPVAHVGPDVLRFICEGSGHALSELTAHDGAVALGGRARLEVQTRRDPAAPAQNVLAVLPGRSRSGEVVVLGAHYDAVGMLPDGTVCPGANDDASGVAVLLEIARSWQAAGFVPERTVLFAAWDGEEKGALGARHFAANPTVPMAGIRAMLELDMVGLGPGPDLHVDGDGLVTDHTLAAAAELRVQVERIGPIGGDSAPFSEAGVPASGYIWAVDTSGDYHRPSDTPATISPDLLRQAGRLAELVATRLGMAQPVGGS